MTQDRARGYVWLIATATAYWLTSQAIAIAGALGVVWLMRWLAFRGSPVEPPWLL